MEQPFTSSSLWERFLSELRYKELTFEAVQEYSWLDIRSFLIRCGWINEEIKDLFLEYMNHVDAPAYKLLDAITEEAESYYPRLYTHLQTGVTICVEDQGKKRFFLGTQKIAEAALGAIYLGYELSDPHKYRDSRITMKFAEAIYVDHVEVNQLENENRILQLLQCCDGIPQWICYGRDKLKRSRSVLVMKRFEGVNLDRLKRKSDNKKLPEQEVLIIGKQMKRILNDIHSRGVIHRDIKPSNILATNDINQDGETVYMLIDFGSAVCFSSTEDKPTPQTLAFASINGLCGARANREDDYFSLLYTLTYLLEGQLPWLDESSVVENIMKRNEFEPPPCLSFIMQ